MRKVGSRIFVRAVALLVLCVTCGSAFAQSAAQPASGFAEVNGTRLYYEARGAGPAVVLVHGGLVDSRLWDDQMGPLARRFRVVRYDLRGYGRSAAATESFSHLEDLRGLLDLLGIEKATLVGLSLGGIIAADFALEHPARVSRLVLVGPGLRGDKQPPPKDAAAAIEAMKQGAEAFAEATMKRELYAAVRPGTRAHARLRLMLLDSFKSLSALRPGFLKYPDPPTAERLSDIKAPTLVLIGSRDGANLRNIADTLTRGINGARKVVINRASHHPPVETPQEFNRALLVFLERR